MSEIELELLRVKESLAVTQAQLEVLLRKLRGPSGPAASIMRSMLLPDHLPPSETNLDEHERFPGAAT